MEPWQERRRAEKGHIAVADHPHDDEELVALIGVEAAAGRERQKAQDRRGDGKPERHDPRQPATQRSRRGCVDQAI